MDANLKKTANIVAKPWVFFLMMFLALAAFGLANLLYDSNEGYASSTSHFDFTSISTDEDPVTRGLSCVADYYENQWVVEDGFPSEKDTVRFPGYAPLQGKTFSGFASYVFTLEGIAEGTEFCLVPNNQPCAYQVYYKFASEPEYTFYFKEGDVNRQFYSFGSGDSVARKYLKSTGEAVTFVYETGFNRTGGIVNHVTFANKQAENRRSFQQITYAIEAAVPISCIVLSAVAFSKDPKSLYSKLKFGISFALPLLYMFSLDFAGLTGAFTGELVLIPTVMRGIIHSCLLLVFMLVQIMVNRFKKDRVFFRRTELIFLASTFATSFALSFVLCFTPFGVFALVPAMISFVHFMTKEMKRYNNISWPQILYIGSFVGVSLLVIASETNLLNRFTIQGWISLVYCPLCLFYGFLILENLYHKRREADALESLLQEESRQKGNLSLMQEAFTRLNRALPYIDAAFERNVKEGDEMLELVSQDARACIDAERKRIQPLSVEAEEVERSLELHNKMKNFSKEILFDIDEGSYTVRSYALVHLVNYILDNTNDLPKGYLVIQISEDTFPMLSVSGSLVKKTHRREIMLLAEAVGLEKAKR